MPHFFTAAFSSIQAKCNLHFNGQVQHIPWNTHNNFIVLCFANVLLSGFQSISVVHLSISFWVTSQSLRQYDCPSAREATLKAMGKIDETPERKTQLIKRETLQRQKKIFLNFFNYINSHTWNKNISYWKIQLQCLDNDSVLRSGCPLQYLFF